MKTLIIQGISAILVKPEITGLSEYLHKLQNNIGNDEVFEDLLFEGYAALMFSDYGIKVNMQDSPDLLVDCNGEKFCAEVKHFRQKEQDIIDDENMQAACTTLVEIGNTLRSENSNSWDQVLAVVKKKCKQFKDTLPNILVIGNSSSNCIDDSIMPTAIHMIQEQIIKGSCDLRRLNGVMLLGFNVYQRGNVFYYPLVDPIIPLKKSTESLLNQITLARPWLLLKKWISEKRS